MSNPLKAIFLLFHGGVPFMLKFGFLLVSFGYFVFPLDLIPDFLVGIGQIDDIGVLGISASLFVHAAEKALADREEMHPLAKKVQDQARGVSLAATLLILGVGVSLHLDILTIVLFTVGGSIAARKLAAEYYGRTAVNDYVIPLQVREKRKNDKQYPT